MFSEVEVATHVGQSVLGKTKKLPELLLFLLSVSRSVQVDIDEAQRG